MTLQKYRDGRPLWPARSSSCTSLMPRADKQIDACQAGHQVRRGRRWTRHKGDKEEIQAGVRDRSGRGMEQKHGGVEKSRGTHEGADSILRSGDGPQERSPDARGHRGGPGRAAGVGSFYVGNNMEWPHLMEQSLRAHVAYEKRQATTWWSEAARSVARWKW